jgi:DNA invertase Pin-like site-specific DNA recombinase
MANKAFAYLRTSSATNVGEDKDSGKRQRAAIEAFARRAGYSIIGEFNDAAVRGADAIDSRKGFAAMMEAIAANGCRIIIVETASRFARDLIIQETGFAMLRDRGITLIAADSPDAFLDDTPTAVLIRQVLGAVSQFEKAMLVSKLKGARDRIRKARGKCEGRKSLREFDAAKHGGQTPMIDLAKKLRRKRPKGGQRSLREIADELEKAGYVSESGRPYAATAVARMIGE